MSKPKPEPKPRELAPCRFCKKDVDLAESFCYGCKAVVCDSCDLSLASGGLFGSHSADDHTRDPEADE